MTLQQLHYIVAVHEYRHFGQAATACKVTQSTLSSMIQKLETEMDVVIFDRKSQPVEPTALGQKLIDQAKVILYHTSQFEEIVELERQHDQGDISLGVLTTVAPYILPALFKNISKNAPKVNLEVSELRSMQLVHKLQRAELDMAIMTTPVGMPDLIEIPLYKERFFAYVAPSHPLYSHASISPNEFEDDKMWLLKEGHCLKNQVQNIGPANSQFISAYEEGSIDTLVRIVDANGGYTLIPELHIDLLKRCQKRNIRPLNYPEQIREISLVVRNDFVKERLLNILVDQLKKIIPQTMINQRLKKFSVKI
ncbi:transcriptional regulator, LysR family [Bacteroides coprosuis DSM 18011]|uniref:Transcriptional regulator, LysR family n=1 Tax=Bacteroides coprosuis DSM 18011 TaxID=679937 RepID=F3ZRE3_9BACE|nr:MULTISPECIES: hydrogen peroxide-inducible genes activator [Bacteroides]EGJ71951.1 transcriptional regulator, LysR family [Bacteroides coprosuis DSM 18011]HJD92891.1 hydrogen peroxide-inducible genes activator [Bacteroides coprosuis]